MLCMSFNNNYYYYQLVKSLAILLRLLSSFFLFLEVVVAVIHSQAKFEGGDFEVLPLAAQLDLSYYYMTVQCS